MADQLTEENIRKASTPPGSATVVGIFIMSVLILLASGYMLYTFSANRTNTAASNPPAQTGYAPIVDEVRRVPAPSTVGQGGERN